MVSGYPAFAGVILVASHSKPRVTSRNPLVRFVAWSQTSLKPSARGLLARQARSTSEGGVGRRTTRCSGQAAAWARAPRAHFINAPLAADLGVGPTIALAALLSRLTR